MTVHVLGRLTDSWPWGLHVNAYATTMHPCVQTHVPMHHIRSRMAEVRTHTHAGAAPAPADSICQTWATQWTHTYTYTVCTVAATVHQQECWLNPSCLHLGPRRLAGIAHMCACTWPCLRGGSLLQLAHCNMCCTANDCTTCNLLLSAYHTGSPQLPPFATCMHTYNSSTHCDAAPH
jgi:hypothetical protein